MLNNNEQIVLLADRALNAYQQARALAEAEIDREVLGYCDWGLGCCQGMS